MRGLRILLFLGAFSASAYTCIVHAEILDRKLLHNPFSRPSLLDVPKETTKSAGNGKGEGVLELTATLVSSNMPLVIADGELLGIGEEKRGYRLISVEEGKATFRKNGRTVTFWLANSGLETEQ